LATSVLVKNRHAYAIAGRELPTVSVEEWRVLLKREGYVINHKKLFRALPGRKACGGEGNGASL
jgi:hypothetical protein